MFRKHLQLKEVIELLKPKVVSEKRVSIRLTGVHAESWEYLKNIFGLSSDAECLRKLIEIGSVVCAQDDGGKPVQTTIQYKDKNNILQECDLFVLLKQVAR